MTEQLRVDFTDQTTGDRKTVDLTRARYSVYSEPAGAHPRLDLYFSPSATHEHPLTLHGRQAKKAADLLEAASSFSLDDE